MDRKCKVSIVTVCLNSKDTIEKAMKSVLEQSYQDIEYIIIDGGSTDGTIDIIKKYEAQIAYWVSEPDQGIYYAMNKGIKKATGELIAFLSSNDWYEEGALSKIVETYLETKSDVIYGDVTFVDGNKKKRENYEEARLEDFYYCMPVVHPVLFVRTNLQKKYMFDESYRIAADYKFYMQIYHDGYGFSYVNANIAYYCLGGISSLRKKDTLSEGRRAAYEVLKEESESYREGIEKAYLREMLIYDSTPLIKDGFSANWITDHIGMEEKIYLFGTGAMSERCHRHLENAGMNLVCYIDNDSDKVGRKLHGLEINSPQTLRNVDRGTIFITSTRYADEIEEQVEDMGIDFKIIDGGLFFQEMVYSYVNGDRKDEIISW